MDAQEAVGEDPASEVRAELPLHEPGDRPLFVAGPGQKGFEVFPDGLMKDGRLGTARAIGGRW